MIKKIVIDWNAQRQTMDGFGVCGAFKQAANLQGYPQADRTHILDALFSQTNGAGISMLRCIVGDSGTWGDREDGPTPSIMPRQGEISDTGDEDQIWLIKEARRRGCARFISSVWSPPAWMKTTGTVTNGGTLKAEHYADFANYLAEYIQLYRERHGIDIYAISPANEPDYAASYSSCEWSGAQFADFYKNHLVPVFADRNIKSPTFGPETIRFGNASLQKYAALFDDHQGMPEIVAMHGYEKDTVIEPLNRGLIGNRRVWMTELCEIGHEPGLPCDPSIEDGVRVARNVHDYLTKASCSAYVYFWGMSKYNNNSALVQLDLEHQRYTLCKRLYTFGQFSRFIRPGYTHIACSHSCGGEIAVSSYRDGNGNLVIVAVNESHAACECQLEIVGATIGNLIPYVTDRDRDIARGQKIAPDTLLKLPANSVTTYLAQQAAR